MKTFRLVCVFLLSTLVLRAEENPATETDAIENGFLAIEGGIGFNTYETSQYSRIPLFFTGGSAQREISTRLLLLSDVSHSSDYFSGNNTFLKAQGLYLYNFGLLDVDYLSWQGKMWAVGLGAGMAHQGFLMTDADKSAHALVLRLRGQGFLYWFDYLATQFVFTLPVAIYQGTTSEFKMVQGELNLLFDFKGRVRNPEPQSFMFSVSLHYDYTHISHAVRTYSQHELTPMFKAMVLY